MITKEVNIIKNNKITNKVIILVIKTEVKIEIKTTNKIILMTNRAMIDRIEGIIIKDIIIMITIKIIKEEMEEVAEVVIEEVVGAVVAIKVTKKNTTVIIIAIKITIDHKNVIFK